MTNEIGKIFKIPVWERHIRLTDDPYARISCLCVDGVGFFLHHEKKEDVSDLDSIRSRLAARRRNWCLVRADTPEKAIDVFFDEWSGTKVGGTEKESKARWIDKGRHILELPVCELLHTHPHDGEYICGPHKGGDSGEFGMCILYGADEPIVECSIERFYEELCAREKNGNMPLTKMEIGEEEYSIIKSEDILHEA